MKSLLQISLLIAGLIFLSAANAETCKEKYNDQWFNHVNIWKNDHAVYCYYEPPCEGRACPPGAIYMIYNYEPKDGPWKQNSLIWSCTAASEDCRFKKVGT